MSEFKVKNSLAVHTFIYSTIKKIEMKVKEIPLWETKKGDHEVLKTVCKFINDELESAINDENAHVKLNDKQANNIDKSKIVVQALSNVFELTEEEQLSIQDGVDFLLNNKLVKNKKLRRSIVGKLSKGISKIFFWAK